MATPNEINSNFRQIAIADAGGNVFGVNISNVGNLRVAGGTSGQVLSTDGTGNLSWATSSGGGGTTSYVNVSRTGTSQTITAVPTTILWNSSVSGSIPYNSATGEFTLTAGVTYQLNSEIQLELATGSTFLDYQWYNVTGAAYIGTKGSSESLNSTSAFGTGQPAQAVITPSVTTVVSVRVTAKGASNGLVRFDYSFASINQLGSTAAAVSTAPTYSYGTWATDFAYPAAGTTLKPTSIQAVGIPYDSVNGLFTLTAGKTYRLEQQFVTNNTGGGAEIATNWQTAAGVVIGTNSADGYGVVYPATTPLLVMYQPSVDTQIKTVVAYRGGAATSAARFCHIAITEIGSTTGLPAGPTIVTEPLTIGATTTAPTKATTREEDYITVVDDKSGWCTCNFQYAALSATGATAGNGYYLYSLPSGYAFDTTVHPIDTNLSTFSTYDRIYKIIPGSTGIINFATSASTCAIVPYSSTQFRIISLIEISGIGHITWAMQNQGYYQLNTANMNVGATFRFKKA